jgi:hypothetical protein
MAFKALIGALRVSLGLETAQFSAGSKKAQSELGALRASMASFAKGALGALSFVAVTAAIKSVVDQADNLGKAAQKIGIPVAELSKLQYSADLADVSLEQLQVGVGKLSKAMESIAGGENSDASRALAAIGVSAVTANGQLRPTSDVLADIAGKFETYRDGASKTALAMALFGKSGADLIPLLNGGKNALKEQGDELERLGGVIDDKAARAAERFNDDLTRLTTAGRALLTTAVIPLLEPLARAAEATLAWAKESGAAKVIVDSITQFLQDFNVILLQTQHEWYALTTLFKASTGLFDFSLSAEQFSKDMKRANADVVADLSITNAKIEALRNPKNNREGTGVGSSDAAKKAAPIFTVDQKAINEASVALKKLKSEARSVFEDTRTPLEKFNEELRKLDSLRGKGLVTTETYGRAVAKLKEDFSAGAAAAAKEAAVIGGAKTPLEQFSAAMRLLNQYRDQGLVSTLDYSQAVIKLQDDFKSGADAANSSATAIRDNAAALATYTAGVRDLEQQLAKGGLTQDAYVAGLRKLKEDFDIGSDATARAKTVMESNRGELGRYVESVRELDILLKQGALSQDDYTRAVARLREEFAPTTDAAKNLGQTIGEELGSGITNMLDGAIDGTLKLQDALKDILSDITKLAANSALRLLFKGGLGSGGFDLYGGTSLLGSIGGFLGFAKGGSIMASGTSGIDSQLVSFRKSPNERVDISKPGQSIGSGGNVSVQIINQNGSAVETRQSTGPGGEKVFQAIIRDAVKDTIGSGAADVAMARYGVRPQRTVR